MLGAYGASPRRPPTGFSLIRPLIILLDMSQHEITCVYGQVDNVARYLHIIAIAFGIRQVAVGLLAISVVASWSTHEFVSKLLLVLFIHIMYDL